MTRYLFLNVPDVNDYKHLPSRSIAPGTRSSFEFYSTGNIPESLVSILNGEPLIKNPDSILQASLTTSFIIIRNDTVLFEKYYQGHDRQTPVKTFSISKNVISALIGIALEEGLIKSLDDPITHYIPEIKDRRFEALTIKHCLSLTSGIKSDKGNIWPWNDKVKFYYSTDIRKGISKITYAGEPGKTFNIEEISPMILGLVLERATGKIICSYLREKIWEPLGMEYGASWVTDNKNNGFEVANSGLVAVPMDMARFAKLYLDNGVWNNSEIIPENWISTSTKPDTNSVSFWKSISAYSGSDVYYRYTWWGLRDSNMNYAYTANGHFGQRIYIQPSKHLIILRFGKSSGKTDWTAFMQEIASKL